MLTIRKKKKYYRMNMDRNNYLYLFWDESPFWIDDEGVSYAHSEFFEGKKIQVIEVCPFGLRQAEEPFEWLWEIYCDNNVVTNEYYRIRFIADYENVKKEPTETLMKVYLEFFGSFPHDWKYIEDVERRAILIECICKDIFNK